MPAYAKNGFRVYAIDLLGCGRTDRPDIAYTIGEQVELIQGFLTAVHVEKADVIGWSMGGWIATEFALQHPQRVNRLVAMDSAGLKFKTELTPDILEPNTVPQLEQSGSGVDGAPVLHSWICAAGLAADDAKPSRGGGPNAAIAVARRRRFRRDDSASCRCRCCWYGGNRTSCFRPALGSKCTMPFRNLCWNYMPGAGTWGRQPAADRMVPAVIDFLRSQPPMAGGEFHY